LGFFAAEISGEFRSGGFATQNGSAIAPIDYKVGINLFLK